MTLPPDLSDLPPDLQDIVNLSGISEADEHQVWQWHNRLKPPSLKQSTSSLKQEADVFIERHKARRHKGWFQVRQAVTLLTDTTGDIAPDKITVLHYRQVHGKIKDNPNWSDTTRANIWRDIRTFLKSVAADHNLTQGGRTMNG